MAVLGRCAVPPSAQLFSLAANGVSFLTAGKSAADVGISAVVQKDCSMLRVLRAESVCSETRTPAGDANSLVARALSSPLSRSTPQVLLVKDSLDGQAAWVRVFNSAKELQATQAGGATQ